MQDEVLSAFNHSTAGGERTKGSREKWKIIFLGSLLLELFQENGTLRSMVHSASRHFDR
jgi:hypothetical protein